MYISVSYPSFNPFILPFHPFDDLIFSSFLHLTSLHFSSLLFPFSFSSFHRWIFFPQFLSILYPHNCLYFSLYYPHPFFIHFISSILSIHRSIESYLPYLSSRLSLYSITSVYAFSFFSFIDDIIIISSIISIGGISYCPWTSIFP